MHVCTHNRKQNYISQPEGLLGLYTLTNLIQPTFFFRNNSFLKLPTLAVYVKDTGP